MLKTKQELSGDKFYQNSDSNLILSGDTYLTNFSGETNHFATIKGLPNLNVLVNNLSFAEDPSVLQTGAYDPSFVVGDGFNSAPSFVAEFDDKLYFGGGFSRFKDFQNLGGILPLNDDGTKYTGFSPGIFNGVVSNILVDGSKYLLTGSFTTLSGTSTNRIVRLNSDGTRDSGFTIGSGFAQTVNEVVRQSDGKFVAVGTFTTYNGTTRNRIARLNTDGTLDTGYNLGAGFGTTPTDIVIQSDDKVIVGGSFTTFSGVTTNRIVRINTNGTRDSSFVIGTGFNAPVLDMGIQSDGKIVCVGSFVAYSGVTRNRIVRLNTDGSIDSSFVIGTGFDNAATSLLIDSNDKILVGGTFTAYSGQTVNMLVRLNSNGALDTSFVVPSLLGNPTVTYIAERSNGNYIITTSNLLGTIATGNKRKFVVEVTSTGSIVASYTVKNSGFSGGGVQVLKNLSTNKILVAGSFSTYDDNSTGTRFMRINGDASFDTTFTNGNGKPNGDVNDIEIISGETKMLLGGNFSQYNSITNNLIAKLNIDGTLDSNFSTGDGFDQTVYKIKESSTGKIYVGGLFTSFDSIQSPLIVRLNHNGDFDNTFDIAQLIFAYNGGSTSASSFGGYFNRIHELNDGSIILTGPFDLYDEEDIVPGQIYYRNLALKLTSGGTIDLSYGYPNVLSVDSITNIVSLLQSDDKLIIAGEFTLFITGGTDTSVNGILRLTNSGLFDTEFHANIGSGFNGPVTSMDFDDDGGLLIGGTFTEFNGNVCNGFVKLNSDGTYNTSLNVGVGFLANSIVSSTIKYGDGYLIGGTFTYYQNHLAQNLVLIGGGASGFTVDYSKGIKYVSDISNSLEDLSLTHKKFVVDTINATLNTFNNGLTKSGNNIHIGGSLTGNTGINTESFNLTITGTTGSLSLKDKTISLVGSTSNGTERTKLVLTPTGGTYYDTTTGGTRGIKYGGNYISGLTDTSLVPKLFVTNLFDEGSGLSFDTTGNTVNLGGILRTDTLLSGNSYNVKVVHNSFISSTELASNIIHENKNGALDENYIIPSGFEFPPNLVYAYPDGKLLVVGSSRKYNNETINIGIQKFNADGTVDTTFNSGGTGSGPAQMFDLVVQPDGKILLGGQFFTYNNAQFANLLRLNSNGTIDSSFILPPTFDLWFNSSVFAIALQSDGKIVVGGFFTEYSGITYNKIIRLNSNGTIDSSFVIGSGFNQTVDAIVIQSDGKIVVGGTFTSYSGVTANKILRLHPNGTLDATYNSGSGFVGGVEILQQQSDGKILVSGNLVEYNGLTDIGDLIRLNTDGTIDNTFVTGQTNTSGGYDSVKILPDGRLLVGGNFASFNGFSNKNGIAILNSDGTYDNTFNAGAGLTGEFLGGFGKLVSDVAYSTGTSKIFAVGRFMSYNNLTMRKFIVRLNTDGTLDNVFTHTKTGFNTRILCAVEYDNDRIMVGGSFSHFNGIKQAQIARLYKDGRIDNTFNSGFDGQGNLSKIIVLDDGSLIINSSGVYSGTSSSHLGILKIDGNGYVDPTFKLPSNGQSVNDIKRQSDGKYLLGGTFTTYSGNTKNRIVRLHVDGGIDTSFVIGTGFNAAVTAIGIQSDGKILVSGDFTTYSGVTRNCMARLHPNGTLDATFNLTGSGLSSGAENIIEQPDGKILVSGSFTAYNGSNYRSLLRLNSDGTIDNSFIIANAFSANGVGGLHLDSLGRVLAAGQVNALSGETVGQLFRLYSNGEIDKSFSDFGYPYVTSLYAGGVSSTINNFLVTESEIFLVGQFMLFNGEASYFITRVGNNSDILVENSTGLKYGGDYSNTFDPRSIPDVGWVSGYTSVANGLSRLNNKIVLGGTLTGVTTISGTSQSLNINFNDGSETYSLNYSANGLSECYQDLSSSATTSSRNYNLGDFTISHLNEYGESTYSNMDDSSFTFRTDDTGFDSGTESNADLSIDTTSISLFVGNDTENTNSSLFLGDYASLQAQFSGRSVQLILDASSNFNATFYDGRINKRGIEYHGNYTTGFTTLSLVHKGYVDNHQLTSYTVGTLPSPTPAGRMIFVSDEAGGAVPAFSDGANWRRVTDRNIVS